MGLLDCWIDPLYFSYFFHIFCNTTTNVLRYCCLFSFLQHNDYITILRLIQSTIVLEARMRTRLLCTQSCAIKYVHFYLAPESKELLGTTTSVEQISITCDSYVMHSALSWGYLKPLLITQLWGFLLKETFMSLYDVETAVS